MPLFRYFTFVGGALLALLLVAPSFFPEAETVTRPDVVRPVIRIASDRVGPPRVAFDTRPQTPVVPTLVSDILTQAPVRQVEAQLVAHPPTPTTPLKIERKTKKIAKRPDHRRMAANPQEFQPFHLTW